MMMQVHYYYHYLVRLWYIGIFFSWICYLGYPIFGWVLDSLIPRPLYKAQCAYFKCTGFNTSISLLVVRTGLAIGHRL